MRIYINGYPASRETLDTCLSEQADNIVDYYVGKNGNIILRYDDEPKIIGGGKHEEFATINQENCKWYGIRLNGLGAAIIIRSLQDLLSQDKLIKDDAYRYFGTNDKGELLDYIEPFFPGEHTRQQYYQIRQIVCESIKKGKIEQLVGSIYRQYAQQQNNNK